MTHPISDSSLSSGKREHFCLSIGPATTTKKKKKKKNCLTDSSAYLSGSFNLLWAAGVEAEAGHCPGMWTHNLFNFALLFKALPPGRLHVSDKGAICFSFPPLDKRGEKTLYIVMLSHPFDISKIEARAKKDRYKLKANTKTRRWEKAHNGVRKSICSFSDSDQRRGFVCSGGDRDGGGN